VATQRGNAVLKSLLRELILPGCVTLIAILFYREYERTGGLSPYGDLTVYGNDARIAIVAVILMAGLYNAYFVLKVATLIMNPKKRQEYASNLSGVKYWICAACCRTFRKKEARRMCPLCHSTDIERLSGYFERHPERKAKVCGEYNSDFQYKDEP
jgi:hypothetical protein